MTKGPDDRRGRGAPRARTRSLVFARVGPTGPDYFRPLCPKGLSEFTVSAERTEHEGAPAVALLFETRDDTKDPAGSAFGYVLGTRNWLVLDAGTWLPLSFLSEAGYVGGVPQLVRTATFTNDIVRDESLPADFFDPAALGYVEPDPIGTLEASVGGDTGHARRSCSVRE